MEPFFFNQVTRVTLKYYESKTGGRKNHPSLLSYLISVLRFMTHKHSRLVAGRNLTGKFYGQGVVWGW